MRQKSQSGNCIIRGCTNAQLTHHMCNKHYQNFWRQERKSLIRIKVPINETDLKIWRDVNAKLEIFLGVSND